VAWFREPSNDEEASVAARWETAHLAEIETVPVPESLTWIPVRRHFGIDAFGVNAYRAGAAGEEVVERHTEEVRGHEELYVVVTGRASFTVDGEGVDAPAGTLVFIRDPSVERHAVASEPGTTILALGGKPGVAYTPGPWEWVFAARAMGVEGDHAGAIAEIERGLEVHPDNAALLYRLACWEATAGRADDALAHLAQAVELREELRGYAQREELLASIRDDARFPGA
jgi:mannose-6-phosphate isomerase-like protein (cupin superfamily)